jgi:hypothetical protein
MSSLLFGSQEPNVGDAVVILRYMLTMVTCVQVLRWVMCTFVMFFLLVFFLDFTKLHTCVILMF